jgi:hypothetical protein
MRWKPALATIALAASLTGCAPSIALQPADNAIDPLCAEVVVRLPDTAGDLERHETNAQGTGAWGTPTGIILRCGVAVPEPTSTLPCVRVGDVYWLRDDVDAPNYIFTTYGRDPATEVIVNQEQASPGTVLYDLESAVAQTAEVGACTEIEDSLG